MEVVSYIKDSFQEYEGLQALVLFSKGCNFKCSYCYNYEEVINPRRTEPAIKVLQRELNPMHDAVVFLGGEPTIWGDGLIEACKFVKLKNLKTKVYTNASNPDVVKQLVEQNLLDSISVDLKTIGKDLTKCISKSLALEDYLLNFIDTVAYCKSSNIPVEVRTTIYGGLNVNEVKAFMVKYFPDVPHILTRDFRTNLEL